MICTAKAIMKLDTFFARIAVFTVDEIDRFLCDDE